MIDVGNMDIYFKEISPERLKGYRVSYYINSDGFNYVGTTPVGTKHFQVNMSKQVSFTIYNVSRKRRKYRSVIFGEEDGLLSDLLPDADLDNLRPYEVGILKLKYGLTQEDIRIPEVFKQFL